LLLVTGIHLNEIISERSTMTTLHFIANPFLYS
jgi:hypothetical protein